MHKILLPGILLLAAGCASGPPEPISKVPHENPSLTRARIDIDAFIGAEVRWGGVISKVENKTDQTWIEIVRLELDSNGKPVTGGNSDGRFIAGFDNFLDPVVYKVGRRLTVVGKIEDSLRRPIGEYDYLFPIVAVEGSFLWQAAKAAPPPVYPYPYPWWYYDPWYPRPWPYYRHPRHY